MNPYVRHIVLGSPKSCISVRKTVVLRTLSIDAPAASTTACRFSSACPFFPNQIPVAGITGTANLLCTWTERPTAAKINSNPGNGRTGLDLTDADIGAGYVGLT